MNETKHLGTEKELTDLSKEFYKFQWKDMYFTWDDVYQNSEMKNEMKIKNNEKQIYLFLDLLSLI